MLPISWVDPPPAGTKVCAGFDGSTTSDWTGIKLETVDGLLFTPRYGPDRRPTVWNPAEWGGRIPRSEVSAAWVEIRSRFALKRAYCDPWHFQTEIEQWDASAGGDVFFEWHTNRERPMHAALDRFMEDLRAGGIRHDGCPLTTQHMLAARKLMSRSGERFVLGKPSADRKIDLAMCSVLAHEAAADARVDGWGEEADSTVWVW